VRERQLTRVLVFGDTHIPTRKNSIPEAFFTHIQSTHYDLAMITGDLVQESEMRAALPELPRAFIVRGNMDFGSEYNFSEQIQLDEIRFLLIHGTQLRPRGNLVEFLEILNHTGADVGIHGHTHTASIDLVEGRLFINPGTISGATGGYTGRAPASFVELDVNEDTVDITLHYTDWRVIKQTETSFKKMAGDMIQVQ